MLSYGQFISFAAGVSARVVMTPQGLTLEPALAMSVEFRP